MNKRQTRLFAIGSTALAALVFLGLTIDSHRQFGTLTNADKITPQVIAGKDVWHANNCINCHTLFGEGAYYAPDLTKITKLRGEAYLTAYLKDPVPVLRREQAPAADAQAGPERRGHHGADRLPRLGQQRRQPGLAAAADPGHRRHVPRHRPAAPAAGDPAQRAAQRSAAGGAARRGSENPIALGETSSGRAAPACTACHSIGAGGEHGRSVARRASARGPSSCSPPASTRARRRTSPATSANRSRNPSAYLVPGAMYSANGTLLHADHVRQGA